MNDLIRRIEKWIDHNFPNSTAPERTLGLAEEAGEVCRAVLKKEQKIRGTQEYWLKEIEKELGDVFIKIVDVAHHHDIDLEDAINRRVQEIEMRDWIADPLGATLGHTGSAGV